MELCHSVYRVLVVSGVGEVFEETMKGDVPIIPAKYNCIKASGKCELRQFPDTNFECVYENFCPWREDEPQDVKSGIDKG